MIYPAFYVVILKAPMLENRIQALMVRKRIETTSNKNRFISVTYTTQPITTRLAQDLKNFTELSKTATCKLYSNCVGSRGASTFCSKIYSVFSRYLCSCTDASIPSYTDLQFQAQVHRNQI